MFPVELVATPRARWVETEDQASDLLNYIGDSDGMPIAVDTETTGTDRARDHITCWSMSDGRRRYTITRQLLGRFENFLQFYPFLIFHGANFDSSMFQNSGAGMNIRRKFGRRICTQVMHQWIRQNVSHKLEDIAERELGLWKVGYKRTFGKDPEGGVEIIDPGMFGDDSYKEAVGEYASWDAYLTFLAWMKFDEELKRHGMRKVYYDVETRFMDAVYLMERNGVMLDVERLKSWKPIYEQEIAKAQGMFNRLVGKHVDLDSLNMDSPKQLHKFFFETLGRTPTKRSKKTGAPSADKDVVGKWAEEGDEISVALLTYRQLTKQSNTYVADLLKRVRNGRVYTNFNMHTVETGRLSSSEPNLQNIPVDATISKDMRKKGISYRELFIPGPGRVMWDFDYDQLEMCIGAHLSRDKFLVSAICEGKDTHCFTASRMFDLPYDELVAAKDKKDAGMEELTEREKFLVSKRNAVKPINFGIFYGKGPPALAKDLHCSLAEAEERMNDWFACYPGVVQYINERHREVWRKGYVTTLLGRKRFIEGARSIDWSTKGEAQRMAVNSPVQGSAADAIRIPMIKLAQDRILEENDVKMVLQIHDELLFEAPADLDPSVIRHIEEVMVHPFSKPLLVPLSTKGQMGSSWGAAK